MVKSKKLIQRAFKRKILNQEINFYVGICYIGWSFEMGELLGPVIQDISDEEIVKIFREKIEDELTAKAREILKGNRMSV